MFFPLSSTMSIPVLCKQRALLGKQRAQKVQIKSSKAEGEIVLLLFFSKARWPFPVCWIKRSAFKFDPGLDWLNVSPSWFPVSFACGSFLPPPPPPQGLEAESPETAPAVAKQAGESKDVLPARQPPQLVCWMDLHTGGIRALQMEPDKQHPSPIAEVTNNNWTSGTVTPMVDVQCPNIKEPAIALRTVLKSKKRLHVQRHLPFYVSAKLMNVTECHAYQQRGK